MLKTFINALKDRDIRRKLLITFGFLLIYRLGCFIPIPGLNLELVSNATSANDFMQILSTITGGSLSQGTLFALGILPYINSSIILQLLTLVIPALKNLRDEGEEGVRKQTQITRYVTIGLALVQAIGVVVAWKTAMVETFHSTILTQILVVFILVGGSMLCMWLGERITEYGIGNGVSLIIFIGILSSFVTTMANAIGQLFDGDYESLWYIIGFLIIIFCLFALIVFVDAAERRIRINYGRRIKGNKQYGGGSTFLPIKVNAGGVMPIIFASSFLMFPQMIASFWPTSKFYIWYSSHMGTGSWVYIVLMSLLILFFSYFYSMIQFDPSEIARNLKNNSGTIPGINPGRPTAEYLGRINNRITFFGAIYLAILSLIPSIGFLLLGNKTTLVSAFTATGMLIVVSVALEFHQAIEAQLDMKIYDGLV